MIKPSIPRDEAKRLEALRTYQIVDTPPEEAFDRIARLAALLCDAPMAAVSFVEADRVWAKACIGCPRSEVPRELTICGHAILADPYLVIEDAFCDERTTDNPICSEFGLRFYAGAPLVTPEGYRIGNVCVVDIKPRRLEPAQLEGLRALADAAMAELEWRKSRFINEELRKHLSIAESVAKMGSWKYNLATGESDASPGQYEIFEVPAPQPKDKIREIFRSRIHPSDQIRLNRLIEQALAAGGSFTTEYRVELDRGRFKYVQTIFRIQRDSDGNAEAIYGTCQDLTDSILRGKEREMLLEQVRRGLALSVKSGKSYRLIFDHAPLGIIHLNTEGRMFSVNAAFAAMLGYAPEELNGKTVYQISHPDDIEISQRALRSAPDGQTIRLEKRYFHKSGREVWVRISRQMVDYDEKSGDHDIIAIVEDITAQRGQEDELRRAQARLEESKRFLRAVLDNVQSMIFVKNYKDGGKFSLLNKVGQSLLGIAEADFLGKTDFDLFPNQADQFLAMDNATFSSGVIQVVDSETIQTVRGTRYLRTYKVPTYDEKGEPDLLIGISEDVTDELLAKQELEMERAKSIQSFRMASLGELSAGVAHEINNPLAIIAGSIPLLEKYKSLPEKFEQKVNAMNRSVERITKIVNGLRKFARSPGEVIRAPADINLILGEVLVLIGNRVARESAVIETDLRSTQMIVCDEMEIEQVLVNLLSNSIDAVSDCDEKRILVRTFDDGPEVAVQVQDSGVGIPEAIADRLFQPFLTTKPVGRGTGLGLSIVKGILDQHGATIQLIERRPRTCFELRFPAHQG